MHTRVLTREDLSSTLAQWTTTSGVGIDFETNGKELWEPDSRIVGVSLAGYAATGDVDGLYIPLAHKRGQNADPLVLPDLLEFLARQGVIPYYIPMEVAWAWKKWKLRLEILGDAYVAGRILHYREAGLKDSVEKFLKKSVIRIEECLPPNTYDFSEADADAPITLAYTCEDAVNAVLLAAAHEQKIREHQLDATYRVELQSCAILAIESARGYYFNSEIFQQELHREKTRVTKLEQEVFGLLGGTSFLINSGPQLGKKLAALGIESPLKTKGGNPSWSREALMLIQDKHAAIPKIVEWKSSFAVSNMLSGKAAAAADGDGRVHPTWNPMSLLGGGRFACEKPPMPTLPKPMRRAFSAPTGQRWVMLQWLQPELRMLALLSKCHTFAEFLSQSGDPFQGFAYRWETTREIAKNALYTYINSAGDIDVVEARIGDLDVVHALMRTMASYPEIETFLADTAEIGVGRYHVRGWLNRRFKCEEEIEQARKGEAVRAVLVGSVATALKVALCKIDNMRQMFEDSGSATGLAFKGLSQVIPAYDTLYYTIDMDVPLAMHFAVMTHEFQLNLLEGNGGEFYLPTIVGVGSEWGSVEVVPDAGKVQEFADAQVSR